MYIVKITLCFVFVLINTVCVFSQEFMEMRNIKVPYNNLISKYTTWADVDKDGDLDLYFCNVYNGNNRLLAFKDTGFVQITETDITKIGGNAYGSAWADLDNDGDLDAFVYTIFNDENYLILNNGDSTYNLIEDSFLTEDNNNTFHAAFCDIDNDGDQDLYLSFTELFDSAQYENMHNQLYLNDGDGNFSQATSLLNEVNFDTRHISFLDYNGDGWFDVFLANFQGPNLLFKNNKGEFELDMDAFPVKDQFYASNTSAIGDIDSDGDLDIYVVNVNSDNQLFVYENGKYVSQNNTNILTKDYISGHAVFTDFDVDGTLDLYSNDIDEKRNIIHIGLLKGNAWLGVKLKGLKSNAFGVGAKVGVLVNGKWQYQQVASKNGAPMSGEYTLLFGLDKAKSIDSIKVFWPSGIIQAHSNLAAFQYVVIEEGHSYYKLDIRKLAENETALLKDVAVRAIASFSQENRYLTVSVLYTNLGLAPTDVSIDLKLNKQMSLTRSFPKINKQDERTYTWNIKDVVPGKDGVITMIFQLEELFEELIGEAVIFPIDFDEKKSNNTYKLSKRFNIPN
jgi:hypothetical protein